MIAKRRAYATLQSHLTPPFMESDVRGIYKELCTAIQRYNDLLYADGKPDTKEASLKVKRLTVELGIHRELRLDSLLTTPYTEREIARIETFAEELANEKVMGTLYTMGEPYAEGAHPQQRVRHVRRADRLFAAGTGNKQGAGKASADLEKHKSLFIPSLSDACPLN